jgi:hypothetical protein
LKPRKKKAKDKNPKLVEDAKKNLSAAKVALEQFDNEYQKTTEKFKKIEVQYLISIGKIKPPKILTPREKIIARQKKLSKLLDKQYLKEKAIVDAVKMKYEDAVYENKEAKKLDYKEKIDKTAALMTKRKAKLDGLMVIFKPIQDLKDNFVSYNKAIKEERFKDADKAKNAMISCRKAITEVQRPLIEASSKKVAATKIQLDAMKTAFKYTNKMKRDGDELEKTNIIIDNKSVFVEKDKIASALKAKVNEVVIKESEKKVRIKQRKLDKMTKKKSYSKLLIPALNKKIKELDLAVEEEKKSKDENKKA